MLLCNCCWDGVAGDVLFLVIVAVKAFMVQLLSPRLISLSGTINRVNISCRRIPVRLTLLI